MKIVARVPREDEALVTTLTGRGITAKLVRGATMIELPALRKESWGDPDSYDVPAEVAGVTLAIDVAESGGGATNTGNAVVVSGLSGKALKPYYQPRRGSLAGGTHAFFSIPVCVTVTASRHRSDVQISIRENRIEVNGQTARIVEKTIWEGEPEELPRLFDRFDEVVAAAVAKSNCYHCRESHYIAT